MLIADKAVRCRRTRPRAAGCSWQERRDPAPGQPILVALDYDRQLYGERHLIENFFAKIKQFRAIATRYEKTARNFLAAVHLVASVIWLN